MNAAYSPWKFLHHHAHREAMQRGEQPAPLQVQLIISDLCNQDCNFCAYRMSGYTSNQRFNGVDKHGQPTHNPARFIPFPKILEILDDCQAMGVKAIQLTGGGEPSVHPHFLETLHAIQSRGLDLALVTNGVNLKGEAMALLAKAQWLRISLDAGSAVTYTHIRQAPAGHFERACANLKTLVDCRNAVRATAPARTTIGVGYVVTRDNWHEVGLATARVRALGVDNIRISALFTQDDENYHAPFYAQARVRIAEARMLATPTFDVVDLYGERLEDLRQHRPDYRACGYMQLNTYIGGDLNVYRCCTTAYNDRGLIGSLKEQRFRDLWQSAAKQADFRAFDARGCERCMFNGKNRFIAYALEPEPLHVNYV